MSKSKRKKAKQEHGIVDAENMQEQELDALIEECNIAHVEMRDDKGFKETVTIGDLVIIRTEAAAAYFDKVGITNEKIAYYASERKYTKMTYNTKYRAFECFIGDNRVDWCSIGNL